jgi:hypothetical protein
LIKKIRKEHETRVEKGSGEKLPTPGKKRYTRPENTKVQVNDFDRCVIRNIIHDFYATKKEIPTAAKRLPIVTEKIFHGGENLLTRVVKIIGFTWRKCNSKWCILIEKLEIVLWRHKYFVQMKRFRGEGKEIFYVDESWIDSNITFSKYWQGETEFDFQKNFNAGNRLLRAGSENGFLHNAMLVYKAGAATGDYHRQMNGAKANSINAFILNNRYICDHIPSRDSELGPGQ